jgi:hypothetical protein
MIKKINNFAGKPIEAEYGNDRSMAAPVADIYALPPPSPLKPPTKTETDGKRP